ncbi:MAG: heme biosynthesis HemY N-terminal domain-containing protein [Ancalomicrobiaceae bacterium]|nr:heme biosynthesis HemY N-terminal domain-containing protein [Ancalomicrobiaceae bacterium]
MIRLLVYLAILVAVAFGFAWLADRPGDVTLVWQGQTIETDLMTVTVGILGLVVAVLVAVWLVSAVLRTPFAIGSFFERRRRERGWRALSQGMIAAGAGDPNAANKAAVEARRILAEEPLALLLEAQAAQLSGNRDAARAAFERMLEAPETRLLGLRGLYVEAERYGEAAAARHFAEEATADAPRLAWAGQAVMEFQSQSSDWAGALDTLDRNARNRIVDRTRAKRLRAVLMTARAVDLEQGDPDQARGFAVEAHGLAPDLVPAAVIAGRLLTRQGDIRRAARILEAAWKLTPHPDIATAYAYVRSGDSAQDRLNRVKELTRVRAHHAECAFAIASAAIDARDYAAARGAIKPLMAAGPTRRVCLLMADIEEAEHGDEGKVREWLSRAVRAPRDATWVADGFVSDHWAPVSPITGRLDAFEWKVPEEDVAALPPPVEEPEPVVDVTPPPVVALPAKSEAMPPEPPPAPKVAAPKRDDTPEPVVHLVEAVVAPELAPKETPATEPTVSSETAMAVVAPAAAAKPEKVNGKRTPLKPVDFPLGFAPDDPGAPVQKADAEDSEGRYRLYS